MSFYRLIQGDCLKVLPTLEDESIDLIMTDPPYAKEFNYLYRVLAEEGKRVLKEGGYLFAYCGAEFLPSILSSMCKHLNWFWLFEIQHRGGNPRVWYKKLMIGSKPVVVFTKGKPKKLEWMCNLHSSKGKDKKYHVWGQDIGFPMKIIDMLTDEGDVILDPLLGGGTTMFACQNLKRNCIGIEIDSKNCDIIKNRCMGRQFLDREVEYSFEVFD